MARGGNTESLCRSSNWRKPHTQNHGLQGGMSTRTSLQAVDLLRDNVLKYFEIRITRYGRANFIIVILAIKNTTTTTTSSNKSSSIITITCKAETTSDNCSPDADGRPSAVASAAPEAGAPTLKRVAAAAVEIESRAKGGGEPSCCCCCCCCCC